MSIFRSDLEDARQRLLKEKRKGFMKKFFSLGILNNDQEIRDAEEYLKECDDDFNKVQQLILEADYLDKADDAIELHGIRISKNTFADLNVINKESYPIDWQQLREEILKRDNYTCQEANGYCQGSLQIHHIIELSRGGTNNPENLIALCKYHHACKHPHMQRGL